MAEKKKNVTDNSKFKDIQNLRIGDNIVYNVSPEKHTYPKSLTVRVPKTYPDEIVGREQDLEDLKKRLYNNKKVVLVNGLGGIGKTTLAQAYATIYREDYEHIAWISQTSENIIDDFVFTDGLCNSLNIRSKGIEPIKLLGNILTEMRRIKDNPNLLIIDNADNSLKYLYDCLPEQPDWHVIVTSRERIPKFNLKTIGFLDKDKAKELFYKHYTRNKITEEEVEILLKKIGYHTLTIEILAKTAHDKRLAYEVLKNAIKEDIPSNAEVNHSGQSIENVTSYLCSIFDLGTLSEDETWLLKQFVCLPPEFHEYDLLKELINPSEYECEEIFSETLDSLSDKGWIIKNEDNDCYKMHRIISEVTQRKLEIVEANVIGLIESITDKLFIDESKDNPVDKFTWIPFGKSLSNKIKSSLNVRMSVLWNNLGLVLQDQSDYINAKEYLEKALASDEKNYGHEHTTTAISYSNLGLLFRDLGNYGDAKEFLEKAVSSDEKNLGPDHPNTARSYSNLALILKDLGDYKGAKEYLEKALASDEKNFGVDHPKTVKRYINLAMVQKDLGDFSGVKENLIKSIISNIKNFGPDHPTIAISYSNLGSVMQSLGDYKDARRYFEKALLLDEKNYGSNHPNTAIRYSNLATVLIDLGDLKGALDYAEKSLAVFQSVLPEGHPNIGIVQGNVDVIRNELQKR